MMPPADTGARRSVPDAWQALRLAHLIPSCRDHRRRTNKRGGGHVSKGGGLLFEARSAAGPSPGVTRESLVDSARRDGAVKGRTVCRRRPAS